MNPWKIACTPEEAGLSSKGILNYLDALEKFGLEHHSILVIKNGMLACKMNFAPYDDQTPHILFSLSKSFCSAAAGFAVQEGLISWDSRVLDVLSDKAPDNPSVWLRSVTLHDLLTMGSGLAPESDCVGGEDWMKAVLACECDAEPGTRFHYNSHGTYLVSAMVQRVVGMNIRDYLMPRLFEPLGIPKPEWDTCPLGVCVGGWGLHLSPNSIARFGQCVLQKGVWQGKQVLPVEWLDKATSKQIENAAAGNAHPDWSSGYGYQFWRTRGNRFRGDGMFGQLCMISPEKQMVVAITAGLNDMGKELDLLNDYLFPAADMPPAGEQEQQELQNCLQTLGYAWPEHEDDVSVLAHAYAGEDVKLTVAAHGVELRFVENGKEICASFGWGDPVPYVVEDIFIAAPPVHWLGAAGWKDGCLSLIARTVEGPFMAKAEARLTADGLTLSMDGVGTEPRTVLLQKE